MHTTTTPYAGQQSDKKTMHVRPNSSETSKVDLSLIKCCVHWVHAELTIRTAS